MVHPADAEAWKYFDGRHSEKAGESRNVRVALATDGFNPYGMAAAHIHLLACVRYPSKSTPWSHVSTTEHILIVANPRIPGG